MKLLEKDFYDYKTAPVNGNQVVDLHRTGMSFYDDFLSGDQSTLDYLHNKKNLKGEVVMMSPEEYFQACSDYGFPGSHPSVEALKASRRRDESILNHLKDVLTIYKHRFPMPMLNKAESGQEGLHRMMVIGDMFGWNHKVPVLVVDWADKQLAFENEKKKRIEKIEYRIKQAVQETLRYKFSNIEELHEQLQWELDKQFEYEDDFETPIQFDFREDGKYGVFVVTIGAASYEFDYDDVKFIEASEDVEENDDIDLDDIEDFLKRHFGDDWRKTHPHLKDTFHIEEEFDSASSNIKKMDEYIQKEFGNSTPGEGCVFIPSNGKFVNIYPKLDDHEDLCYWLEEQGFENIIEDAEWFVDEFNYIRCRNSLHLTFVQLPMTVTSAQLRSLEEWMENRVSSSYLQVEVPQGKWKKYNLDEYFPEDIIRLIKRYYSSGTLYEKLK